MKQALYICTFLGAVVAILVVAEVLAVLPERLLLVALHGPHRRAGPDFCIPSGYFFNSNPKLTLKYGYSTAIS